MIIIFYDANEEKLHICSPNDRPKVVSIHDPNVMDYVANDDILYVTDGHWFEKRQFSEYLQGNMQIHEETPEVDIVGNQGRWTGFLRENPPRGQEIVKDAGPKPQRWYIHATGPGVVRIEDITTPNYPEGLELHGQYDFIPIDTIGQDVFDESPFARVLLAKKRIDVVGQDYVDTHKHKKKSKVSPAERALQEILVPIGMKAEDVAANGGLGGDDVVIPIMVEG